MDSRKSLIMNTLVIGGSTCFPGFCERLKFELGELDKNYGNAQIIAKDARKFSSFIGAAILVQLSDFENKWVTKEEYEEFGMQALHRKANF